MRASRVRGGRRSGASAGVRPSRHIHIVSIELQNTQATAAAFQRCMLGLWARQGISECPPSFPSITPALTSCWELKKHVGDMGTPWYVRATGSHLT